MKENTSPTAVETTLLRNLYDYGYLTVKQVERLHYAPTVTNYVRERLASLEKREYLMHTFLSRSSQSGRSPSVYTLAQKGYKYFADHGLDTPTRFRPSEVADLSHEYLDHTLAINDFLIAASLLEKTYPDHPLIEFRHERTLKQHPTYIQFQGKKIGVILDSWLKFQLPTPPGATQPLTLAVGLELDRGTRDVTSFKRKLRHLLHFIHGPYQKDFHTNNVTIAFAVRHKQPGKSPQRVMLLRQWCEEVLTEENATDDAVYFFFCALPDTDIDPAWLFLQPTWLMPFDTSAQILLDPNA